MPHVISTLSNDQDYRNYEKSANDLPIVVSNVVIKGGANVAKVTGSHIFATPHGISTKITGEQLAQLEKNSEFCAHRDRGFLKVVNMSGDAEKIAKDMKAADGSAQRTPNHPDYQKKDVAKPYAAAKK